MEIKENDIIMCTVKSIEGTTVFLNIDGVQKIGSIVMSEIAAGRIRNIREYVSPSKKVVCKVLKILQDHIELSLRRVTGKEREEIQERYKKEKNFENILKVVTKNSQEVINKIKESYELWDFYDQVKENSSLAEKILNKPDAEMLINILKEKKDKEKIVKKIIILKSNSENGLDEIKEVLRVNSEEIKINYLGSSKFAVSAIAKDYKDAEHLIDDFVKKAESKAKERKMVFEIK